MIPVFKFTQAETTCEAETRLPMNQPSDTYTYDDDGLVPIETENDNIGQLLRKYSVSGIDGNFWTDALLRHILKRERITAELQKPEHNINQLHVDSYVDRIHPLNIAHSTYPSPPAKFLKVFALLVLKGRCGDIGRFIAAECNDEKLPIEYNSNNDTVYSRNEPNVPITCFNAWSAADKEYFESYQWKINTPYFSSTKKEPLKRFQLRKGTKRPWRRSSEPLIEHSDNSGAYGTVTRVDIHPTSHSYQGLLTGINLNCTKFAIKTLHVSGINIDSKFNEEWEMLKRFSGLTHPHLVTVLSAFKCEEERSFIFPNASYDLSKYMETHEPPQGKNGILWLSDQLVGLMGALGTIHNPEHLHLHLHQGAKERYGRHGDIKCDNILCFERSGIPNDIVLVISDFGLSAFNTDKSRSNIPNKNVPPVPGYRPPECDIDGGTVSRAFDVWTIGCLYLDLITWFLGGGGYVEKFSEQRTTLFINGSNNDIFFTLKLGKKPGTYVAQVKDEVTRWILQLHQHPKCSDFIHDALNVVEQEMLVVISADRKRSTSEKLVKEYKKISDRCMSKPVYTRGRPWGPKELEAARKRMSELNMAVDAVPNKVAKGLIRKYPSQLPVHKGETRKSLRADELESMDN